MNCNLSKYDCVAHACMSNHCQLSIMMHQDPEGKWENHVPEECKSIIHKQ